VGARRRAGRFDRRVVNFPRETARQMEQDGMIMAMQHRVTGAGDDDDRFALSGQA
jgi:hypothetical protein